MADSQEESSKISLDNVGVAFGLVIGAGLATGIGSAAAFNARCVKMASKLVLASSLGFSSGVMIYVSFAEITGKSELAFLAAGKSESDAKLFMTLGFFGGMALLRLISMLVHMIDKDHDHGHVDDMLPMSMEAAPRNVGETCVPESVTNGENHTKREEQASESAAKTPQTLEAISPSKLKRMGLDTAAAIALHNLPEGLATFVATLAEPSVGVTLAVAIAVHNIPEGLCVALPIYYATGSRMKGFMFGLLSGISEPIGALIGYLIIKGVGEDLDQLVYASLFALVAGMMVMISIFELLPTAFSYDRQDKCVTNSVVLGMAVMAASLVLFAA